MSLRLKFNMMLLLAMIAGLAVAALIGYQGLISAARDSVRTQASLMMDSALAIRNYTSTQIRPLLADRMEDEFLPQSVASYAANTNFDTLRKTYPEYTYKEATLNPTNLRDKATDWEADIVHQFRNNRDIKEIFFERETPSGSVLTLAHPLQVNSQGCLACHGVPEDAPASMRRLYGDVNGYGWQMNEIIGAQVVSVPMDVPVARAQEMLVQLLLMLVGVFAVLALVLNLMLHSTVIRPVQRMATIANDVSLGRDGVPEYVHAGGDEVSVLSAAFNRMRRSLENAMKMLER